MNKTKTIVINSILLALLIICGKISFPIGVISFNLQLLIVFLIAFYCKLNNGLSIILIYLLLGIIGFPFFSYGGGISYVYQPSFGFLLGYVFMIMVIRLSLKLLKNIKNNFLIYLISGIIGLLVVYICGCVYAYIILLDYNYSMIQFFQLVLFPFIGLDLIKLLLSIFIYNRTKKYINNK